MWLKRALVTVFLLFSIHAVAFAQIPGGVQQHGSVTPGDCTDWYGTGVIQDAGAVCGSGGGGSLTVGTTTITGGTTGQALTINGGVLGSAAFGTGTVTSVATGPGAVGGTITTSGTISTQELTNSQTGSNYAILTGDWGKQDQLSNAANQIPTIAAAGSTGFPAGFFLDVLDPNTGVQLITPATSTINGMPTWAVLPWNGCRLTNDGTNYWCTNTASLTPVFPNASSTGTTINKLAKLTGAPSTVVITATTDTSGAIGVVVSGAGTTGNAQVANSGLVPCTFDGATTAGHYVEISANTAGDCEDTGAATYPTSGQVLGRVLSTNVSGGVYLMDFLSPGIQAASAASGNALFGTTTGNTSGDVVTMSNTTVGVQDSGTALTALAPLANPTFTGTPAAPTPGSNVNTTQIPTSAWVNTYFGALAAANSWTGANSWSANGQNFSATGAVTTPNIVLGVCGSQCGIYATATGKMCFVDISGTCEGDYAITSASAMTLTPQVNFSSSSIFFTSGGTTSLTANNAAIKLASSATGGATTLATQAVTGATSAGAISLTAGGASGSGVGSGASVNITAGASTSSSASSGGGSVVVTMGPASTGAPGTLQFVNLGSAALGTAYLCWNSTGNIVSEDTTCIASDEKLKKNVRTINESDLINKFVSHRGVRFEFKSNEPSGEQIGVIAQEWEKDFPELMRIDRNGVYSFNYEQAFGLTVAVIDKMQSEIEDLKRRVH